MHSQPSLTRVHWARSGLGPTFNLPGGAEAQNTSSLGLWQPGRPVGIWNSRFKTQNALAYTSSSPTTSFSNRQSCCSLVNVFDYVSSILHDSTLQISQMNVSYILK